MSSLVEWDCMLCPTTGQGHWLCSLPVCVSSLCSAIEQGHRLCPILGGGGGWVLGKVPQVGSTVGWALRLPSVSVQTLKLYGARDYAQHLDMAADLTPCLSRAVGWTPRLPRSSGQAFCWGRTRGSAQQLGELQFCSLA